MIQGLIAQALQGLGGIVSNPTKALSIMPMVMGVLAITYLGLYGIIRDGQEGLQYLNFLQQVVEWCVGGGVVGSGIHAITDYLKNKNSKDSSNAPQS